MGAGKDRRRLEKRKANAMADVLVTTDWVAQHATDASVRVVEVDVDTTAYDQAVRAGAAGWNWTTSSAIP
jgi:thiosulfate/3-mercaptopyruvate sulfurtransferase